MEPWDYYIIEELDANQLPFSGTAHLTHIKEKNYG
jgi:hypothetical protein